MLKKFDILIIQKFITLFVAFIAYIVVQKFIYLESCSTILGIVALFDLLLILALFFERSRVILFIANIVTDAIICVNLGVYLLNNIELPYKGAHFLFHHTIFVAYLIIIICIYYEMKNHISGE